MKIYGWHQAPLDKTQEWLEATTFDETPLRSAFRSHYNFSNVSLDIRLGMAAELGDGRAIANLVQAGVEVDVCNRGGQTALHKAAMMGHRDVWCLSVLISLGADVFREVRFSQCSFPSNSRGVTCPESFLNRTEQRKPPSTTRVEL